MKSKDIVYVLVVYDLFRGEILSIGKKNIKVRVFQQGVYEEYIKYFALEKVAEENESIAIIWEIWKGVNGRGGYRIERNLYPDRRKAAKNWPTYGIGKKYLWEETKGILDPLSLREE